ncbi:MAG TPA: SDR family NAD(P)-dependent oxidoreductase [Trebonia sp.]|jgi:short-subunit dehydrogenase|nr:SDR family NAD(P)-dependent oxidoreductase [Trebonia sp.]
MNTIAVFGAGPALGMAVARRFGREGFRVALVARDRDHLDGMAGELARAGVMAAGFQADLTDGAATAETASTIADRLGPIDVLEYNPARPAGSPRVGPSGIDVAIASSLLNKVVLPPVALVGQVLPGMLERGSGALLFTLGASAKYPMPRLARSGMAGAALRSYIHALHVELAPRGVYAGTLLIGALIEGSAAHRNAAAWRADTGGQPLTVVSADDLADRYWDMYVKRDRAEDEVPDMSAAAAR